MIYTAIIPIAIVVFALYVAYLAYVDDKEQTKRIRLAEQMSFKNQVLSQCAKIDDPELQPELEKLAKKYGITTDMVFEVVRAES